MTGCEALRLRDGRRLAYRAVGPRGGALVLYLHGAIGAPQSACPQLESIVEALGLRYVLVSRPGFGDSDPLRGRTLTSFAGDVAQFADALGRPRFAVVGVSAGGPYALACAYALPERVQVASVVSCMAPGRGASPAPLGATGGRGAGAAARAAATTATGRGAKAAASAAAPAAPGTTAAGLPVAARAGLRLLGAHPRACSRTGDALLALARRNPQLVARVIYAGAARDDRRLIDEPGVRAEATRRFLAAARGGVGGMVDDYRLCAAPWGFDPAAVVPPVQLWHGALDALVPVDEAIGLAAALPRVRIALHPGEGHFFYGRRLREILGTLASATDAAGSRSASSVDQPNSRAPSPCPDVGW